MKPKTIALLVVAVGCGLVASYMTSRVIADRSTTQEVPKVPVVIATRYVPQGQLLRNPEEFFVQRMVPEDLAPRGNVIRELPELKDKRIVNPVRVDSHVSKDDLLDNQNSGLAHRIPPGMRAVTVRASTDISVGGFAQVGMYVDIMCVPSGRKECKTILQKILVLAVNQQDIRDVEKKAVDTHFVTFAVTPDDSEILALASQEGQLRLSLRNAVDEEIATTKGAKIDDLTRLSQVTPPGATQSDSEPSSPSNSPLPGIPAKAQTEPTPSEPAKPEPPPQPKLLWTMVIRNGTKIEKQNFYDEPPVDVQKSDPSSGPETPVQPERSERKPEPKPAEAPTGQDKPSAKDLDGKK